MYRKKKRLNLVLPYRMVCVFYTCKFSKYGLGKERVLKGERLSLAFSNQILKCMDKYTNTFLRQRKIFSVKYTNNWARGFLHLDRRNILLEYIFSSLCDTVGVLLEIFLQFLPSMSIIQFLVNFFERGSALKIVRLDFLLKSLKFFWIHVIILFDLLLYRKKNDQK